MPSTYGHILASTPGSITRAVVGTDSVTIETFTAPQKVTLSWEAFGRLDAYIAQATLAACDEGEAPLDALASLPNNGTLDPAPHCVYLEDDDPEFLRARAALPDDGSGECVEYLGTEVYASGGALHTFRHRAAPGPSERQYWHVLADPAWKPREKDATP